MEMRPLAVFVALFAVVLVAIGCTGDRRRGSSGSRGGDPTGPSSRPGGSPVCSNECETGSDGICDDGGSASVNDWCDLGSDCSDCGTRYVSASVPTTTPAECSCDYYTDECDPDCGCDPDCDERVVTPTTDPELGGFGDGCECYSSSVTGFCESADCDPSLSCFGYMGYGGCTVPCSAADEGSYEVCPPGGQCQAADLDEGIWYICAPT